MKPDSQIMRRILRGVLGIACSLALLGSALAQADSSLPASIVAGTCAAPGAVTVPLANTALPAAGDTTPTASGLAPGGAAVIPVQTSVTTVSMKLADLVDGAHAVMVAQSGTQSAAAATCGNLGAQAGGGDVVVGLAAARGSRYSGIAWLHANGDQTQVTVFVAQNPSGSGEQGEGDAG